MPFVPLFLGQLVEFIGLTYVFGYNSRVISETVNIIFMYQNPALWGQLIRPGVLNHTYAVVIPALIYIAVATAIYIGAYFTSRARKPERTGNSVMFPPIKNVLVFMVSAVAMFILGLVFYGITESFFMTHIGFAIGFAIGYVVAQMIAEKSFYIVDKLKFFPHFFGTATAVYIFIFVFTQYGMGFFVNRVPAKEDISAIYIASDNMFGGFYDKERQLLSSIDDPQFIETTRNAHQTIINGRKSIQELPNTNSGNRYTRMINGEIFTREPVSIHYILKNGKTITRLYSLPGTFIEDTALNEFLDSKEVLLSDYSVFRTSEGLLEINLWFGGNTWNNEWNDWGSLNLGNFRITDRAQMETVLEIIADGIVENAKERRENPQANMYREPRIDEIPPPTVGIRFEYSRNSWQHRYGWRSPHLYGEPVTRLYEQIIEWGLVPIH